MPMRKLGSTGVEVSLFGLGCFPLGGRIAENEAVAVIRRAHELGVNYFA